MILWNLSSIFRILSLISIKSFFNSDGQVWESLGSSSLHRYWILILSFQNLLTAFRLIISTERSFLPLTQTIFNIKMIKVWIQTWDKCDWKKKDLKNAQLIKIRSNNHLGFTKPEFKTIKNDKKHVAKNLKPDNKNYFKMLKTTSQTSWYGS